MKQQLIENQFRQGDVLLQPVDVLPADAVEMKVKGRVVLRYGEATGHAHAFYGRNTVRLFETPRKERFLRVVKVDALSHEEHSKINAPPGLYQLPTQTEWTDQDEPIVVAD